MARKVPSFLAGILLLKVLAFPGTSFALDRVLVVVSGTIGPYEMALNGFQKAFGQGFESVQPASVPALLKGKPPDLVVAVGGKALEAAVQFPAGVPLLFMMALRIDEDELAGRSYVGIEAFIPVERYLSFIQENFPSLSTVGILSGDPVVVSSARKYAGGLKTEVVEVGKLEDVPEAYQKLAGKVSCLLLLPDPKVISKETSEYLLLNGLQAGKPIFTYSEAMVKQGAFAALVASYESMGSQAGGIAVKGASALKGKAEILIPDTIAVFINARTAKALKQEIPPRMKNTARVVE